VASAPPADAVAAGLESIAGADPGFDPGQFLEGARAAFEMIVGAFAAGDKARLRPLLSDAVYAPFSAAIDERAAAGETLETRTIGLKGLDIVEAGLTGRTARITIKFVSDQINVLRAHDGSVVDGDPDHPVEKTDFWSFARDTQSTDPNWALEATASG
jgi:predicted lipid-binding transport protein (Tim44 family)